MNFVAVGTRSVFFAAVAPALRRCRFTASFLLSLSLAVWMVSTGVRGRGFANFPLRSDGRPRDGRGAEAAGASAHASRAI